ncbi:MAG: chemotaxis protein CheA [Clostridiales bacterium]|jgi:two-component system chemotaxis sensor kinase CheA|nr:chemotaxis protein CheA [Clostridiales bacterium]
MDVSQYLEIFIEESKENLQSLNESLLILEKEPNSTETVNVIFRAAHTLKGMSATMGFKRMQKLTHDMENVLSEIRNGKMNVTSKLLDVLFKCLDALEEYINNIVSSSDEGTNDNNDIIIILNSILENKGMDDEVVTQAQTPSSDKVEVVVNTSTDRRKHKNIKPNEYEENAIIKANEQGFNVFGITIYINEGCILKAARAFIIFKRLEELGQVIKASPEVQEIEDEKFDFDFSVLIVTSESAKKCIDELSNVAEVQEVLVDEIVLEKKQGKVEIESDKQVQTLNPSKTTSKSDDKTNSQQAGKAVTNRTVRVDIERLDILMNLVSELIIVKNGLETYEIKNVNQNFNESIEYLERITSSLHDAVMKVRMVPVERVFNRFPRMLRDLSRQLDKKIELHMSGEDTELDRTVIDEIGDPLVHLLRNAADHGLETPEERIKRGKDEIGNVYLDAYQDGNNVVIEVRDDGYGIDCEKIRKKAVEKGTISAEFASNMTETEIIELLFRPSFSMAEKISEVSGRGVGLDVVKTKIEALGGVMEVKTKLGEGSVFTIRLPLTLAIIQGLMVELNTEKYAIPIGSIQTIEEIKVSDIKLVQSKEVIHLRNHVIPLVRLDKVLNCEASVNDKKTFTVVIVSRGDKLAGLVIDSLIGQQEIVIKSLGKYLANLKMIAGATILGDGEVALILDINSLI